MMGRIHRKPTRFVFPVLQGDATLFKHLRFADVRIVSLAKATSPSGMLGLEGTANALR
jgi:hypothetical protein